MTETVLVTGALGLVGGATIKRLATNGRRVVATDLETPANRKKARKLPVGVEVRWADLTDDTQIASLVARVKPTAIVHLAAVIAPAVYRTPALGRKVNVEATSSLVKAASASANRPRLVLASSAAVYGSRNPHRHDPIDDTTPTRPTEIYGQHKLEAETIVRESDLDWVVLRLGGVLSADVAALAIDANAVFFETALPTDQRFHGVDVRDVGAAFAAAVTADVVGETLLIAGDDSHKLIQREVGAALTEAFGLGGVLPEGRPGNPHSDDDWFIIDWMDSRRSQQALNFQRHSWPDMLAEMQRWVGWRRHLIRGLAPVASIYCRNQAAYRDSCGTYADPWGALRRRLGETRFETSS